MDALTDMYQTLLSNDNGLGAFYWEGAWIPVKAGWTNWKYNKDMSDRYGTGWAAQGAKGYQIESYEKTGDYTTSGDSSLSS